MTLKQFKALKIAVTIIVAVSVSMSVVAKNYFAPIMAVALASAILLAARRYVKEIIDDERDAEIGGKAAIVAMKAFSWIAVMAMFGFYAYGDTAPDFKIAAFTLAYSVCLLLILYSAIFKYYSRK